MSGRFEGRVAIVTGAASGIGAATLEKLLGEGAKVLAADLNWDTVSTDDPRLRKVAVDVTSPGAAAKIVAAAIDAFGGLDILVNNAGIFVNEPTETASDETWLRVMDLNVGAMFRLAREAMPHLRRSAHGRVVNIASVAGMRPTQGIAAYAASKSAVMGLTRALAVDLGADRVTANYILPGAVLTNMIRPIVEQDTRIRKQLENASLLGRIGQPEDIANAVAFLASDEASFITGHGLTVDGGTLLKS